MNRFIVSLRCVAITALPLCAAASVARAGAKIAPPAQQYAHDKDQQESAAKDPAR